MKCLTLTQPWATLIAIGAKRIETRSWQTPYRGPLAIHAAAGLGPVHGERGLKALCAQEPFKAVLTPALERWYNGCRNLRDMAERPFMPLGAIVAVVRLWDVIPTDNFTTGFHPTAQERAFGDYAPGRYAWLLADVRPLPEPIPAKGALGLWEYEGDLGL